MMVGVIAAAVLSGLVMPANPVPYICYQPEHASDLLCAGAQSTWPPGYTYSDPGTWQPWPKYSTNPHRDEP